MTESLGAKNLNLEGHRAPPNLDKQSLQIQMYYLQNIQGR